MEKCGEFGRKFFKMERGIEGMTLKINRRKSKVVVNGQKVRYSRAKPINVPSAARE